VNRNHLNNAPAGQALPKLAVNRIEAARMIGVSAPTLDRLVERGLLKPSRATRRPLFPISELERFLAETTTALD
jgi:hypothetical protein